MTRLFAGRIRAQRPHRALKSAHPRRVPVHRPLRFEPLEVRRLLAVITVNTLVDENDGVGIGNISLRDALADSNPNDVIDFSVEGTITLTHGELVIDQNLSI